MIKKNKLFSAYICVIVFCICLIGGFFIKALFIFAIVGLAGYILIDKKYLRCPHCGCFENLERLYMQKNIFITVGIAVKL
jgi:hypothetical protein